MADAEVGLPDSSEPEAVQHLPPNERDEFETRHGITYCRRCGRPLAIDSKPDWTVTKQCQVVRVGPR